MKAITLKVNGGIDNLIYTDVPVPVVKAHEVLVQVKAISINPVDAFVRQSEQGLQFFLKPDKDEKNLILGWDVSGSRIGCNTTEER
jgi:NADPH:quinone reductase-like Zn-dependent oxidoreductase